LDPQAAIAESQDCAELRAEDGLGVELGDFARLGGSGVSASPNRASRASPIARGPKALGLLQGPVELAKG
jgi:hypothetical protein